MMPVSSGTRHAVKSGLQASIETRQEKCVDKPPTLAGNKVDQAGRPNSYDLRGTKISTGLQQPDWLTKE
jgi:hypothetical protein